MSIGIGIGLDKRKKIINTGLSQGLLAKGLFYWLESDGISGNEIPNQLDTDFITIASKDFATNYIPATSTSTFTIPNTTAYQDADADDNLWYDGGLNNVTVGGMIGTNWTRTFIKYDNQSPHHIRGIFILEDAAVLTTADQNELSSKMWLDLFYFGSWNDYGYLKENRSYGGGVDDSDALALIARMDTVGENPTDSQELIIDNFFKGLKDLDSENKFTDTPMWYFFNSNTEAGSKLNWREDDHNQTYNGGYTFTANQGLAFNGTTGYSATDFFPSPDSGLANDNFTVIIAVRTAAATSARRPFGCGDGSNYISLLDYTSGGDRMYMWSPSVYNAEQELGTGKLIGYTCKDVTGSKYVYSYDEGVEGGSPRNLTPGGIPTTELTIGCYNNNGSNAAFWNGEIEFFGIFPELSSQQHVDITALIRNVLNNY